MGKLIKLLYRHSHIQYHKVPYSTPVPRAYSLRICWSISANHWRNTRAMWMIWMRRRKGSSWPWPNPLLRFKNWKLKSKVSNNSWPNISKTRWQSLMQILVSYISDISFTLSLPLAVFPFFVFFYLSLFLSLLFFSVILFVWVVRPSLNSLVNLSSVCFFLSGL